MERDCQCDGLGFSCSGRNRRFAYIYIIYLATTSRIGIGEVVMYSAAVFYARRIDSRSHSKLIRIVG